MVYCWPNDRGRRTDTRSIAICSCVLRVIARRAVESVRNWCARSRNAALFVFNFPFKRATRRNRFRKPSREPLIFLRASRRAQRPFRPICRQLKLAGEKGGRNPCRVFSASSMELRKPRIGRWLEKEPEGGVEIPKRNVTSHEAENREDSAVFVRSRYEMIGEGLA